MTYSLIDHLIITQTTSLQYMFLVSPTETSPPSALYLCCCFIGFELFFTIAAGAVVTVVITIFTLFLFFFGTVSHTHKCFFSS